MYLSQQAVDVLHEERVNELQQMSHERRSYVNPMLWKRLWRNLSDLFHQEDKPGQSPTRLSTQEFVAVGRK